MAETVTISREMLQSLVAYSEKYTYELMSRIAERHAKQLGLATGPGWSEREIESEVQKVWGFLAQVRYDCQLDWLIPKLYHGAKEEESED